MVDFNSRHILTNGVEEFRYAGLEKFEYNNGPGVGITLFTQYCTHYCEGCHNPQTWSKYGGQPFTESVFRDIMDTARSPLITRLTLSGGDPMDSSDLSCFVANEFKKRHPDKTLWLYTGYVWEEIVRNPKFLYLAHLCDVVVDGPYESDKRDLALPFRGSTNQRIIDVQETIRYGFVIRWNGVV